MLSCNISLTNIAIVYVTYRFLVFNIMFFIYVQNPWWLCVWILSFIRADLLLTVFIMLNLIGYFGKLMIKSTCILYISSCSRMMMMEGIYVCKGNGNNILVIL